MFTGTSTFVSYMGDESFAIHHEISIFQKGSVQNAVRYLFDKSSSIGSSTAQSFGTIQSSMISRLLFSKHQVSKILQVSNEMKSQNFFIFKNIII
jgi:hypothetical protein